MTIEHLELPPPWALLGFCPINWMEGKYKVWIPSSKKKRHLQPKLLDPGTMKQTLVWKLRRDANKSISGTDNEFEIHLNTVGWSFHSRFRLYCRESESACKFELPGIWNVSSTQWCAKHHSQIDLETAWRLGTIPPKLLIYVTAVLLSQKDFDEAVVWMNKTFHTEKNCRKFKPINMHRLLLWGPQTTTWNSIADHTPS